MKKIVTLLFTAGLLTGLATPTLASAAPDTSTEDRLATVTQAVKETLTLDTQGYTAFYGDVSEYQLAPLWSLNWSGDQESLTVEATESGSIVSYYYDGPDSATLAGSLPTFPDLTQAEALVLAQDFLTQVLDTDTETAQFNDPTAPSVYDTTYRFSGEILLNGLPSPLSFTLRLDIATGQVTSFSRSNLENQHLGGIPSATSVTPQTDATDLLLGQHDLYLEYVTGEEGTAVLRYLPYGVDEFYVDDATGTLVNLTQLRQSVFSLGYGNSTDTATESTTSTSGSGSGNSLTTVEQSGVDAMAGVLSKEDLDAHLQTLSQLGLEGFTLTSATYQVERQEEDATDPAQVWATLTYNKQTEGSYWRTSVMVDGKTGAVASISGYIPYVEEGDFLTYDQAQGIAQAFLTDHFAEDYALTAPYTRPILEAVPVDETSADRYTFTFARQENGIFYPEQYLTVTVDGTTGAIFRFTRAFEAVTFDSPDGLISLDQALVAYGATYDTQLGYVSVPQSINLAGNDIRPLLEEVGMPFFYSLALGYTLEPNQSGYLQGIDAKTGQPVYAQSASDQIAYQDLSHHWVGDTATALADYSIGWLGDDLNPDAPLTQVDMVALLVSIRNGAQDPAQNADNIYNLANAYDLFPQALRDDEALLTRMDALRILLDSQGLGQVAQLEGIYRCDFTDAGEISHEDLGYAALAQGLSIAQGDAQGNLNPSHQATRADALAMVYQMMK